MTKAGRFTYGARHANAMGKNDKLPEFAQFFDLLPKNLEDAFSHNIL